MDGKSFDRIAREFAAGASRRSILKGLLGLGGSAIAGGMAARPVDARDLRTRSTVSPPDEPVCSPGHQFCGGQGAEYCCPGGRCFDGVCCPDPATEGCGGGCCPTGRCTAHGECCASGHVCGAICCVAGSSCGRSGNSDICCGGSAGGVPCGLDCCQTEAQCCDLECCAAGSICIGEGHCCPQNLICGGVCCDGAGQQCCDDVCLQAGQCCGDDDCEDSPETCQTAFCDSGSTCQLNEPCADAEPGMLCCDSACVHLGDTANCRFCGDGCAPGEGCTDQGCVAPTTTTPEPTTTSTTVAPTTTTPAVVTSTTDAASATTTTGEPTTTTTGVVGECDVSGFCCELDTPYYCPASGSGPQGCCPTPCVNDMCAIGPSTTTTGAPTSTTSTTSTTTSAPTTSSTTTTSTTTSPTTLQPTTTTPEPECIEVSDCPGGLTCCLGECIDIFDHECCPFVAEDELEIPNYFCQCNICAKDPQGTYRCGAELAEDNVTCWGASDTALYLGVCCDGACVETSSCPPPTTTSTTTTAPPTTTSTTVPPTTSTTTTTSLPTTLPPGKSCSAHTDCIEGEFEGTCCAGECLDPAVHLCCPDLDGRPNWPCGCHICAKDDVGIYRCRVDVVGDDASCAYTLEEQGVCCAGACLNQQSCTSTTPPATTTTTLPPVSLEPCETNADCNTATNQQCVNGGCVNLCQLPGDLSCPGDDCTCIAGEDDRMISLICGSTSTDVSCVFHADCPGGYYCGLLTSTCTAACLPPPPTTTTTPRPLVLCDDQFNCVLGEVCLGGACATPCNPGAEEDVCSSVGCTCLPFTINAYCGEALERACEHGGCPVGEFCQPDGTCAQQCVGARPTTTTSAPTSTTPGPDLGSCAECSIRPNTDHFHRSIGESCLDDDSARAPCLCEIGACHTTENICCDPASHNPLPPVCVFSGDLCPSPPTTTTTEPPCGGPCSTGQTCCDEACVDLLEDHFNCGMCGRGCAQGQDTCRNGVCICPNTTGQCLIDGIVNCVPECTTYQNSAVYSGLGECLEHGSPNCGAGDCRCCIGDQLFAGLCAGDFVIPATLEHLCGDGSYEMCHPPGPCADGCEPGVPCLPGGVCAQACTAHEQCGPCGECQENFCGTMCDACETCNAEAGICEPLQCAPCQKCENGACVDDCEEPPPGSCFENYCHTPSGFCGAREDCTRSPGCCSGLPNHICNPSTRKCECPKPCPDGSCAPADGCCDQAECLTDFRSPECRICGDDKRCQNVNCGQQCLRGLCCNNFGQCTECQYDACGLCLGVVCDERCEYCHQGVCSPLTYDRDPCCDVECDVPFTVCEGGQCVCQEGLENCLISSEEQRCGKPPFSVCEHDYECCNSCVDNWLFGKFCV